MSPGPTSVSLVGFVAGAGFSVDSAKLTTTNEVVSAPVGALGS